MNDQVSSGDEVFERLRADIEAFGRPTEIRPEDVGVKLPSAQEMLERAKAAEAASLRQADSSADSSRQMLRPRVLLVVAAAVVAVVLGVSAVGPLGRDSAVADTPPVLGFEFAKARDIAWAPGRPARPVLLRLASAAGKNDAPRATGTTQYVASENWFAEIREGRHTTSATLVPKRRESWVHADGSVVIRESTGKPLRPDGRHDLRTPQARNDKAVVETYPVKSADANEVASLGTDPDKVRDALLEKSDCDSGKPSAERASCLIGWITSRAHDHVFPPAILQAFWLMLAEEPSLRSLGRVRDREARPGIGISLVSPDSGQFRQILIVSPRTGQLLGTERILIRTDMSLDLRAPAIYEFTAIVAASMTGDPGPAGISN